MSNKRGHSDVAVVPEENRLFEVPGVSYSKYRVADYAEFEKTCEHISSTHPFTVLGDNPTEFKGWFEFVFIRVVTDEGVIVKQIMAVNCNVYITNDQGKTLDLLVCASELVEAGR